MKPTVKFLLLLSVINLLTACRSHKITNACKTTFSDSTLHATSALFSLDFNNLLLTDSIELHLDSLRVVRPDSAIITVKKAVVKRKNSIRSTVISSLREADSITTSNTTNTTAIISKEQESVVKSPFNPLKITILALLLIILIAAIFRNFTNFTP